jgi:tRNA dimethylallyltransferase
MATNHARPPLPALRCILIAGPTAVGKSGVALALAERIGGEIISVDSMQVYRGLDIGTAKPSAQDRQRVPHHLIDVAELNEPFDAARFSSLARAVVSDIQRRGGVPILCGGTGLYFKAFLEGLGEAPPAHIAVRAELEAMPLPALLRELEKHDPVTFAKIDRRNPRRVVRALEVIRLTGAKFSAQRSRWNLELATPNSEPFFGLIRSGDDLQDRIHARVDAMFASGLAQETEELLKRGLAESKTAMQAIGYRQVVEHLRHERSLVETIALVKQRTRQFAKRQMTWFRRQFSLQWLNCEREASPESVADRLLDLISPGPISGCPTHDGDCRQTFAGLPEPCSKETT